MERGPVCHPIITISPAAAMNCNKCRCLNLELGGTSSFVPALLDGGFRPRGRDQPAAIFHVDETRFEASLRCASWEMVDFVGVCMVVVAI